MEIQLPLPRLTRYLRTYTNLEPRERFTETTYKRTLDDSNRFRDYEEFRWSHLQMMGCSDPIIVNSLRSLRGMAEEVCGSSGGSEMVDRTALYLFKLFLFDPEVPTNDSALMEKLHGRVNFDLAMTIRKVVNRIVSKLGEDRVAELKSRMESFPSKKIWENLRFALPLKTWTPPDTSFLSDLTTVSNVIDTFSMAYNGVEETEKEKKPPEKKYLYGKAWLLSEIKKCYSSSSTGIPAEELCESIIPLIMSNKTSEELQSELFDFLGFDNIELIQSLLAKKHEIMMSLKLAASDRKNNKYFGKTGTEPKPENYLNQVSVVTAQEKETQKLARKEDKKLGKFAAREEAVEEKPVFDPIALRTKRIEELTKPKRSEIQPERKIQPKKEVYPNVYDSVSEACSTSGWSLVTSKRKKKKGPKA